MKEQTSATTETSNKGKLQLILSVKQYIGIEVHKNDWQVGQVHAVLFSVITALAARVAN